MPPAYGYWGQPTATLDWCENNYELNSYVAEFWNTLSNSWMIFPALFSLIFAIKDQLEQRFLVCYFGLMVVGIGSWCFHMTLNFWMQLFDELPMIWLASALIYTLWTTDLPTGSINLPLLIILVIYDIVAIWVYLALNNPVFHEWSYAFMVVMIFFSSFKIVLGKNECSFKLFFASFFCYNIGFLMWIIDNKYCHHLQDLRAGVVFPVSPFTQLHAWWHCLAGLGTYFAIAFCVYSRGRYLKKSVNIETRIGFPFLRQSLKKMV